LTATILERGLHDIGKNRVESLHHCCGRQKLCDLFGGGRVLAEQERRPIVIERVGGVDNDLAVQFIRERFQHIGGHMIVDRNDDDISVGGRVGQICGANAVADDNVMSC